MITVVYLYLRYWLDGFSCKPNRLGLLSPWISGCNPLVPRRWYLSLSSYQQIHLPLRDGTYNSNSSAFLHPKAVSDSLGKRLSISTAEINSCLDECRVSDSLNNTLQRYNTSIFALRGTVRLFTRMIEHHIYNHMRVADISSSPLTPKHRNNQ